MTINFERRICQFTETFLFLAKLFKRTMLQYGVLRKRSVRLALIALALLWMAFSSFIAVAFFRSIGEQQGMWDFIFNIESISLSGIVIAFFLIVKLLFSKTDSATRCISYLPVSSMMRNLALKACEACIVLILTVGTACAVLVSAAVLHSAGVLQLAFLHLLVPALLLYIALSLVWDGINRSMHMIGIPQFASSVALLVTAGILMSYSALQFQLISDISERYIQQDYSLFWATIVPDLSHYLGALPTALLSILALLGMTALDIAITPSQYCRQANFIHIPIPYSERNDLCMFTTYIMRSRDTMLSIVVAIAFALISCMGGHADIAPAYACVLAFTGMSQFANGIVPAWAAVRRSATYMYCCMLGSQLVVYTTFWGILLAISLVWTPLTGLTRLGTYAALVGTTLILTMIGILFPAFKDNPLTSIAGILSFFLMAIVFIFALCILNINFIFVILFSLLSIIFIVIYSIFGIQNFWKVKKYESF
ncbi:YfhO family protein [Bifidobacterium choloepi]|uniref:YfhO family protein n=1 Tax=Bifidobacterium choloepi TaxID=2614131 RepID=A0A6I5MYY5_9BIFI|nr:YfhO family protein [Bifidobacterium choloepi]NEG69848.1 YfhO family protein [Bifidobacterium choloepi]